ncbi:MAG TPA: COX15/CtaA family protein [Thermomicrobiales bacterium]|nr:COX15/CtaA family protein [Thermomicrobiales bacterium]
MRTAVKRLAVAATIGMFLVLLMGATVTNTGSSEGCGRSWPLCHGKFIPSYTFHTMIEFSHRAVTGIEGFLIAAVAIGAIALYRRQREVQILVAIMVGTLLLQSGLGASAVMWPQSPAIMASHFGISLVCLAAVFLLTRYLYATDETAPELVPAGAPPLPAWIRRAVLGALVAVIGVAYLGAYMRHSDAVFACYKWPTCNGEIYPGLSGPVGISFGHRLAALAVIILIGALAIATYRLRESYPRLWRVMAAAAVIVLLQSLAGGAVVLSHMEYWSTLLHAGLMALLFLCLADACRQVLIQPRPVDQPQPTLTLAPTVSR